MNYKVELLENKKLADPFILEIHYAKRKPSISFAYGLYDKDELIGVCTFGSPASPNLCKGIAGEKNRSKIIELNRLVLKYNRKNEASYLISKSLKLLPKPKIVVSYADAAQNHLGIVYQASNFYFTGTSKPRTHLAGKNGKHSRHIGDRTKRVFTSSKHRYVYINANKTDKKQLLKELNYPIMEYPK
tara:strand:- start:38 stop:598 length:561 start_codon:yes stop_codon:yes gene_type:complete